MGDLNPLVSAILPSFNGESFLVDAVESVIAQTYRSWELILVDDGSTDGSLSIAEDYISKRPHQMRLLRHPGGQRRGTAATRNLGIKNAHGEFIANLDQDDIWHATKLEEQVESLRTHPAAAMTFGPMTLWSSWANAAGAEPDRVQTFTFEANHFFSPPEFLPLLLSGRNDPHGYLARRKAIESVGGYEEHLGLCEDWGLYAKLALRHGIFVSDRSSYYYRQHVGQACHLARRDAEFFAGHEAFFSWLRTYLTQCGCRQPRILRALRAAILRNRVDRLREVARHTVRRLF